MKKILALALASLIAVSALALTSCSKSVQGGSSSAASGASAVKTIEAGTLTVGVDDSYPPMEYKDSSGNTVGFDIDLANEIGKKLGLKVKFVSTAWDGIFQALGTGKFDCIISSVSMTEDRLKAYEFSKAYIANSQMIVVRPGDNSIKTPEDLTGKKVGCQISTTANDSANYLMKKKGIKFSLQTYDQVIQPFQDMKAGRLDAIIVDEVVGQYYIGQDSSHYKAAAVKLTNEPIGVCVKKGNTALRDEIQKAIDSTVSDGKMKSISEKWFKKDLTSGIDTKLKELS